MPNIFQSVYSGVSGKGQTSPFSVQTVDGHITTVVYYRTTVMPMPAYNYHSLVWYEELGYTSSGSGVLKGLPFKTSATITCSA